MEKEEEEELIIGFKCPVSHMRSIAEEEKRVSNQSLTSRQRGWKPELISAEEDED